MKILITSMFLILTLPITTQAVWWNPGTWGKTQIQYVEKTTVVERPVEVIKEVEVTKNVPADTSAFQAKIDALTKTNIQLSAQLADLKRQISNKPVCEAIAPPTTVSTTPEKNTDKVNRIKKKIAELELVKYQFDNLKVKDDILAVLNSTKDLEGEPLFTIQKFNGGHLRPDGRTTLITLPDRGALFQIIDYYVKIITVDLASLGGDTN